MNSLSVFDLDHTLIRKNISFAFGAFLYRNGHLSFWQAARSTLCYFRYKFLQPSMHKLHEAVLGTFLRGMSSEALREHVEGFLDTCFDKILYKPALDKLANARKLGHHLLLLSGSPDFLVGPIARRLDIKEWGATHYAIDAKRRLSKILGFMCGKTKAKVVMERADILELERGSISAFSDSMEDLPLLEVVGCPVGVRPDRRLKDICEERGWEVI